MHVRSVKYGRESKSSHFIRMGEASLKRTFPADFQCGLENYAGIECDEHKSEVVCRSLLYWDL